MNGFAPLTHGLVPAALHPELHGIPYIERSHCKLPEATPARNPAALLGLHNRLLVLLNIRIPAAHSAFIISHTFLGLTLLPSRLILCLSGPSRGRCGVRNLPCRFWLYLRVEYRLFHSVGLSVSFDAVSIRYTYRLAPWLLYLLSDLKKCFCLLTGFARCTTLGVCGR